MPEAKPRSALCGEIAWFLAVALVWATIDIAQTAATTGWIGTVRLAAMTLAVYAACGLVSAALVLPLRSIAPPARKVSVPVTAAIVWGLITAGGYINLVHLPSIRNPITIAANLALLATAAIVAFVASRRAPVERPASVGVAAVTGIVAACATIVVSLPWARGNQPIPGTAKNGAPNVFVVVIDSLRYDRTGAHDAETSKTPALDRLAENATTYHRAYAQASWTKPSVASLFTGLFPSAHQANLRRDRLSSDPTTLPEIYNQAGYSTAVFSANPWISPAFAFDRGVGHFVESERETFVRLVVLLRLLKLPDRVLASKPIAGVLEHVENLFGLDRTRRTNCLRDALLVDEFEAWLDTAPQGPLFAYFHLMSPHIPYDPPDIEHTFPAAEQVELLHSTEPLPEARHRELTDLYDLTVEHGDAMLARIVAALNDHEIFEDSIIAVTADHGEEFFEHGRWGHGKSLYDEVTHVPLVIKPGGRQDPRSSEEPAMLVDLLATVAAGAELTTTNPHHGRDLRTELPAASAYAELLREGGIEHRMLMGAEHKYIESRQILGAPLRRELFDLRSDPGEHRNLWTPDESEWEVRLAAVREQAASVRVTASQTAIDEAANKRLEALGYVEH